MKAVYAEKPLKLRPRDLPVSGIGLGDVLIKVEYMGICGSDLHAFRDAHVFHKPPVMLGHELAGIVADTGSAVTNVKKGDAVTVIPQLAFCLKAVFFIFCQEERL
jgi:L-iditol 2-dehydrogenase